MIFGTPTKSVVFSRLITCTLLCLAFASTAQVEPHQQLPSNPPNASTEEQVRVTPEVRLRKLHLVRPDLIPYPVAFEVYC